MEPFVTEPSKPFKSTLEKETSTSSSSIENPPSSNDGNHEDSKFDCEPNPSLNTLFHQMIGPPPILDGERGSRKTCSVGSASHESPSETSEPSKLRHNIVNEDVMNVSQPGSEMDDGTTEVKLEHKDKLDNNKEVTEILNSSDLTNEDPPHASKPSDCTHGTPLMLQILLSLLMRTPLMS